MKVSLITNVLNAEDTIEESILSVANQTHRNIEHIIVDGVSKDKTLDIVYKHSDKISKIVSEKDKNLYDAMNKGIKLASGDIIGFLHADNFFTSNEIIERVAEVFEKKRVDAVWGDLIYVEKHNTKKIVRYWRSCKYREGLFNKGWMPPHPAFFVKKTIYEKYGYFNTDFEISADYEIMLRFLHKHKISTAYLPEVLVKMRLGGLSNRNCGNMLRKSREDLKAWRVNGLKGRLNTLLLKNVSKIPQFFKREFAKD